MNKLKVIQKEYQTINPLMINIIWKKQIFYQIENTGMSLKKKNE